jgi:phosphatidylinositol alpha-1,6-mannosyltransferase
MTSRHTPGGDFEGYGIAVVEAALCGKPAVVSDNSGLAEAVSPGKTGLVVPQDSPGAVAEAVTNLLLDDRQRLTMGQAARARALSEQTWQRRAEQYHHLLADLVASKQPETNSQP